MVPKYPSDENGEVLRGLASSGVDLESSRIVDFEHCFPDEASARAFHRAVVETVLHARVILPDAEDERGWEVQCRVRMVPTHAAITQTELRLASVAEALGGFPDGWGFLSNADGSPAD